MGQRINAYAMGNKTVDALHAVGQSVAKSSLDRSLLELLYFRVSQINGCALCLDVHSKNLRAWVRRNKGFTLFRPGVKFLYSLTKNDLP